MNSISGPRGPSAAFGWRDPAEPPGEPAAARREAPRAARPPAAPDAAGSGASLLGRLRAAAGALRDGSSLQWRASATPGVTGRALLSAVAGPGCVPGVHRVEVIELARTERIYGSPEPDPTIPLEVTGEFHLNGRRVVVDRDLSLAEIRDRINAVNGGAHPSGVTATVLTAGTGSHRLVLTADHPGSRGIELVDGPGARGVLRWLGIADGTTAPNRSPSDPGRTETHRFPELATPLAALLELPAAAVAPAALRIGGERVRVDLASDSLLDLLERAGAGATLVEEPVGSGVAYRLSAAGDVRADDANGPEQAASASRVLEVLGFVRPIPLDTLEGADSLVRVDGALLRRRGNVLEDVLPGVSLTLLATDATLRSARVSGPGVVLHRDPRSIPPGAYPIRATEAAPGAGRLQITIGEEAAQWDAAAGRVRGLAGSIFDGLELSLAEPPSAGSLGELVVTGEIGVTLIVERDWDAAVAAVERFAAAYSEALAPGREGGAAEARTGSSRLARTMSRVAALTDPAEERLGLRWSRSGALEVDADRLRAALRRDGRAAQEWLESMATGVLTALDRATAELAQEMRAETEAEPAGRKVALGGAPHGQLDLVR